MANTTIENLAAGRDIVVSISSVTAAHKFAGKVEAFCEEYLCSEHSIGLVPFGGRSAELNYLTTWLADAAAPSRLLVVAPAGRGKSAMLVRWIGSLRPWEASVRIGESGWSIAFIPVSIRYETHQPSIFYEMLAARLAEILEIELAPTVTDKAVYYADQARRLLGIAIEKQREILIIIDGIDEALGQTFAADWFPRNPGPALRLVLSARFLVGDEGPSGWLERLRWTSAVRSLAISLPPLSDEGVRDLLLHAGAPLDVLSERPDIVSKLRALSEGEPLLLRLYTEDLWTHRSTLNSTITIEDLSGIRPGFLGYFRHWMRDQENLWLQDQRDFSFDNVEYLLGIFACALGRLRRDDIESILKELTAGHFSGRIDRAIRPLQRFLIGSDSTTQDKQSGYIFSHPKFAIFLKQEYLSTSYIRRIEDAIRSWGRRELQSKSEGEGGSISPYLIQYLGDHLASDPCDWPSLCRLTEKTWFDACYKFEGGYRIFSRDLERTIALRNSQDPRRPEDLVVHARCAILLGSIAGIGATLPSRFLASGLRSGTFSHAQFLYWLEFRPLSDAISLIGLVNAIEPGAVGGYLARVLKMTAGAERAYLIARLLRDAPATRSRQLAFMAVEELLASAPSITALDTIIDVVALNLDGDYTQISVPKATAYTSQHVIAEILRAGRTRGSDRRWISAIADQLRKLDRFMASKVATLLILYCRIADVDTIRAVSCLHYTASYRVEVLCAARKMDHIEEIGKKCIEEDLRQVIKHNLSGLLAEGMFPYLISVGEITDFRAVEDSVDNWIKRGIRFSEIDEVSRLGPYLGEAVHRLADYLKEKAISDVARPVLAELAPYLSQDRVDEMYQGALAETDRVYQARTFSALSPRLDERRLLEATSRMLAIGDGHRVATTVVALARGIGGDRASELAAGVLNWAKTVPDNRIKAKVLVSAITLIPDDDVKGYVEKFLLSSGTLLEIVRFCVQLPFFASTHIRREAFRRYKSLGDGEKVSLFNAIKAAIKPEDVNEAEAVYRAALQELSKDGSWDSKLDGLRARSMRNKWENEHIDVSGFEGVRMLSMEVGLLVGEELIEAKEFAAVAGPQTVYDGMLIALGSDVLASQWEIWKAIDRSLLRDVGEEVLRNQRFDSRHPALNFFSIMSSAFTALECEDAIQAVVDASEWLP